MHPSAHGNAPVVYLAGPMTGYPRFNFDAFDKASDVLRSAGYAVVSPADLSIAHGVDPDGDPSLVTEEDVQLLMRTDLQCVLSSDFLVALPGWEASRGARCELMVARACGIPVMDLSMRPLDLSPLDEKLVKR